MKKADTANLALFINTEDDKSGGYDYRCYSIRLSFVRIEGGNKIRNISFSSFDSRPVRELADLTISAISHAKDNPRTFYGIGVDYRNVYSVDRDRAVVMAKTLTTIQKHLDRVYQQRGNASDFAEFVGRVAECYGITRMIESTTQRGWSYDENDHRHMSMADGIYRLRQIMREWITPKAESVEVAS